MATGLVLDEFNLDLSALATGLVLIVLVVLGGHAIALGDVVVGGAVASSRGLLEILVGGRRGILLTDGRDIGHGDEGRGREGRKKADEVEVRRVEANGGEAGRVPKEE